MQNIVRWEKVIFQVRSKIDNKSLLNFLNNVNFINQSNMEGHFATFHLTLSTLTLVGSIRKDPRRVAIYFARSRVL